MKFQQFFSPILLTSVLFASPLLAAPLMNFNDITTALEHGASVTVTMDLSKCPAAKKSSRGGLKINTYMLRDKTLIFSDNHVTVNSGQQAFLEFLRYRIHSDQTVNFTVDTLSLPSYTHIGQKVNLTCAINQGFYFFTDTESTFKIIPIDHN